MAERIRKIKRIEKTEAELKAESLSEVTDAIAENKESILKAIRTVKLLDEAKVLDALNGAINQRGVITEKVSSELNKARYTPILQNLPEMIFMLGEIDVKELSTLLKKVNKGIQVANQASPNQTMSMTGLMGVLRDQEMNRSLTYFLNMLRGMSR